MGCDYSKQTRLGFDKETKEIQNSIESMQKCQSLLKLSIEKLELPNDPSETIENIKKSLIPHLQRIETLLNDIKNSREISLDKHKYSFEEAPKNKFRVSTKAESSEHLSRGSSPNTKVEKDKHLILEDPAIKAMIEKNRMKFVGMKKNK